DELGALQIPTPRVLEALDRLDRCSKVLESAEPWPGDVGAISLPGGNGAALSTPVCGAYAEALESFRAACEHLWASRYHRLLDLLLASFGRRYVASKRDAFALDFEDLELMALELVLSAVGIRGRLP